MLLKVLGVGLHPAEHGGVVYRDAAVGQLERATAVADRKSQMPA